MLRLGMDSFLSIFGLGSPAAAANGDGKPASSSVTPHPRHSMDEDDDVVHRARSIVQAGSKSTGMPPISSNPPSRIGSSGQSGVSRASNLPSSAAPSILDHKRKRSAAPAPDPNRWAQLARELRLPKEENALLRLEEASAIQERALLAREPLILNAGDSIIGACLVLSFTVYETI